MADFSPVPVSSLAISPDSRLLAAATADSQLSIAPLKRPLSGVDSFHNLAGHGRLNVATSQIARLCFPGQKTVYTATTVGSFARFRVSDTEPPCVDFEVQEAHGSKVELTGIAAVNDESAIVTSGKDGVIRVFDPETQQPIARLSGHKYEVRAVAVAQSIGSGGDTGNEEVVHIVASAGRDRTVRIFDVRAAESSPVHIFAGHTGWVHDVAISGGGPNRPQPSLVSCAGDKTVRVWNLAMMKQETVFTGHEYRVWGVSVASDSSFALSGSTDATVRAWNMSAAAGVEGDDRCHIFQGHRDSVISVAVSRDGNIGVSGCEDGTVHVWDTSTLFGRQIATESAREAVLDSDIGIEKSLTEVNGSDASKPSNVTTVPGETGRPEPFIVAGVPESAPVTGVSPSPSEFVSVDDSKLSENPDISLAPSEVDSVREAGGPRAAETLIDSAASVSGFEPAEMEGAVAPSEDVVRSAPLAESTPSPPVLEADVVGREELAMPKSETDEQKDVRRAESLRQMQDKAVELLSQSLQPVTAECDGPRDENDPHSAISAMNKRLAALSSRLDTLLAVEVP